MSNVKECMRIYGTERTQILTYGVISKKIDKELFDLSRWLTHDSRWLFDSDDWDMRIVLSESEIENSSFYPHHIALSMAKIERELNLNFCFCMLDGAFDSPDEIFSNNADKIYAYSSFDLGINIAMDNKLRKSESWKKSVMKLRNFL